MDEVLDRLPGGFLAFGDDSIVTTTNATLRAMLGYAPGELEGRTVESLLTVPSRIFYQTHVFPLLKMQRHLAEVYLSARGKSNDEVPVLINGARLEIDGKAVNECLLIAMPRRSEYEERILEAKRTAEQATEEKNRLNEYLQAIQAELQAQQEELRRRNCDLEDLKDSLERRVEERTAELEQLIGELQSFNYSIAHDLRAPLRAIISTSAIILEEAAGRLEAEHVDLLGRQQYNATKLASLVDDLLQLSRLGLQPFAKQSLDLSSIAEEVGAMVLANQGRDNVRLHVEKGIKAEGDPTMLQIALQNLIENAVKYSPGGGMVWFGALPNPIERVCYVKDQGIGIQPEYAKKIFEPFQRLHRDDVFPGNGIGLANVERVIRRHGGRVWVESQLGQGSTFFFTLPYGASYSREEAFERPRFAVERRSKEERSS